MKMNIYQESNQYTSVSLGFQRQNTYHNADNVLTADDNNSVLIESQTNTYENGTIYVCEDDYEDARNLKRKKSDSGNKQNKFKKIQVPFVAEQNRINSSSKHATCSEDEEIEFALVPENKNIKGSKELVLTKACGVPQENCSSPTLSSKSLESEIHQSRQQCLELKLKQIVAQRNDDVLTETEINYCGHICHAFHCPKLQDKDCFLPFCNDPKEITSLVESTLAKKYVGNAADPLVKLFYKVVIDHVLKCKNRNECKMPLCKDFEKSENLIPDKIDEELYEVVYNRRRTDGAKLYKHGKDFTVLHEIKIGRGSFGSVTGCWFVDQNQNNFSLALKRIPIAKQDIGRALANSLPIFQKLQSLPNILVPELILKSNNYVLMFQEKADISLYDYMKVKGPKGLPASTCTAMLFDMAKGVNQLHSLGFTHGDIKVSNCVLTNDSQTVKIIDLDTVKEEGEHQISGTSVYAAPEVIQTRTVKKPADMYSLAKCIPVLLYGTEKILQLQPEQISRFVREKDKELADIYDMATECKPECRLTAALLVTWFRKNAFLRQRWINYKPDRIDTCGVPGETLSCEAVLKSYMLALMDDLPKHLDG